MWKFNSKKATTTTSNNTTSTMSVKQKSNKALSLFALILMNIVAVVSLRGLPAEAEYGLGSVFYYVFAAIFFLIPVAIVAAELASTYPQKGGVFRWVGEAFGPKLAFLSMFLLWAEVTIWFPTALTFGAVALAYIVPDSAVAKAIASNKVFVLIIVLIIYWLATILSSFGTKAFARVAKWGGIIGTIIPVVILIGFGFAYVIAGNEPAIPIHAQDLLPKLKGFDSLVLAAGVFLFYAGMEMNAIHVTEIDNPKKNYPLAIMISSMVTVLIFILGTLAIAFILPASEINLTQGLLVTYIKAFTWAGVPWLAPILAAMLAIGVLAGIVTWVSGPSVGMLAVAKAGYLPRWFQKTNKRGIPIHLLMVQGIIVTILSTLFVVLPSVEAAYQILSQLTSILYLIMYVLMFSAAIYLRYSQPNRPRPYRIPGPKNIGMWIFAGLGLIGSGLALIVSFAPPSQIQIGSTAAYIAILVVVTIVFCVLPFIILALRKPHWVDPNSDFAPFTWELEGTKPGLINHSGSETNELAKQYFDNKIKGDIVMFDKEIEHKIDELKQYVAKKEELLLIKLGHESLMYEKAEEKILKKIQKQNDQTLKSISKAQNSSVKIHTLNQNKPTEAKVADTTADTNSNVADTDTESKT
ncbi:putative glutamine/gamma-aminobutyrate antiporter GadC [Mycoplasmopsis verecunda]|uniref:Amino acid/polyamine/organocation transporter, APC superfamily n=1 Tax=Mycoplasmopsis verecunda TaxID=171291 RepID=A0A1T4L8M5_9BACT|nr:putative glutamine/gamma-aminobutyrate antiporter GadC [Mycoplasmopsis verecunda]WPB54488.1 amino acid permease [Mycoplasmopsis verecunda]SJZ51105.1 amino acid/polyamine/organocation transporter, APC superfamily [Mycoplasmopsis verecunda]